MAKKAGVVLLLLATMIFAGGLAAEENKGAESILLFGGESGNVSFPHHQHQTRLGDCNLCHSVFPQKKSAIEEMKAKGGLKKKEVMNKLCIKCHNAEKKAGNKAGPTTCTTCHVKPVS
jgi:hypothetical protein